MTSVSFWTEPLRRIEFTKAQGDKRAAVATSRITSNATPFPLVRDVPPNAVPPDAVPPDAVPSNAVPSNADRYKRSRVINPHNRPANS